MVMKVKENFFKYCSWYVLVFACHVIWFCLEQQLPLNSTLATLVIIKKVTDDL